MYHPTRGGVRGGKDQFSWDQVKTDKDRECYLGHSLMAPVGRWQEGKDLIWYSKEGDHQTTQKDQEFLKAKELEEQALMSALGYKIVKKEPANNSTNGQTSSKQPQPKTSSESESSLQYGVSRPTSVLKFDNKKVLDSLLIKLIKKHGLKKLIEALEEKESKSKDKKKKKKKKSESHSHKKS